MPTTLTFTLSDADADATRTVAALCSLAGKPPTVPNARAYLIAFLSQSVTSVETQAAQAKVMAAVSTNQPVVVT